MFSQEKNISLDRAKDLTKEGTLELSLEGLGDIGAGWKEISKVRIVRHR